MRWLLPLLTILAFATGMAIVSRNPATVLNTGSHPPSPGDGEWYRAEQAKPKENEKAAKRDQTAAEVPPSVVKSFDRPDSATNPSANGAGGLKESTPYWSPEWSIVWATLGLVLVTGVQVVMFLIQLRYMRVGMNDAKTAAEAARSAAEATAEANRISAAQFAVAERPWVSVTVTAASDLAIMSDNRYLFVVRTTLKNHGRSAALQHSRPTCYHKRGEEHPKDAE